MLLSRSDHRILSRRFLPNRTGVPSDVLLDCCGAVVLLLVALAAAAGTAVWWKIRHSIPVNLQTPPLVSLPPRDQPEALPQTAVTQGDSSSRIDAKPALRPLVTGIWHTSSADSSTRRVLSPPGTPDPRDY